MATEMKAAWFETAAKLREYVGRRLGGVCTRALVDAERGAGARLTCDVEMSPEGWRDLIAAEAGTGTNESGPCEVVRGVVVRTDQSSEMRTCLVHCCGNGRAPFTVEGLPWPVDDLQCHDEVTITVRKVGRARKG